MRYMWRVIKEAVNEFEQALREDPVGNDCFKEKNEEPFETQGNLLKNEKIVTETNIIEPPDQTASLSNIYSVDQNNNSAANHAYVTSIETDILKPKKKFSSINPVNIEGDELLQDQLTSARFWYEALKKDSSSKIAPEDIPLDNDYRIAVTNNFFEVDPLPNFSSENLPMPFHFEIQSESCLSPRTEKTFRFDANNTRGYRDCIKDSVAINKPEEELTQVSTDAFKKSMFEAKIHEFDEQKNDMQSDTNNYFINTKRIFSKNKTATTLRNDNEKPKENPLVLTEPITQAISTKVDELSRQVSKEPANEISLEIPNENGNIVLSESEPCLEKNKQIRKVVPTKWEAFSEYPDRSHISRSFTCSDRRNHNVTIKRSQSLQDVLQNHKKSVLFNQEDSLKHKFNFLNEESICGEDKAATVFDVSKLSKANAVKQADKHLSRVSLVDEDKISENLHNVLQQQLTAVAAEYPAFEESIQTLLKTIYSHKVRDADDAVKSLINFLHVLMNSYCDETSVSPGASLPDFIQNVKTLGYTIKQTRYDSEIFPDIQRVRAPELSEELRQTCKAYTDARNTCDLLNSKLSESHETTLKYQEQIEVLEHDYTRLESEKCQLENHINALEIDYNLVKKNCKNIEIKYTEVTNLADALRKENCSLLEKTTVLEHEKTEIFNQANSYKAELDKNNELINRLHTLISNINKDNDETIKSHQQRLTRLTNEKEELQKEFLNTAHELEELRTVSNYQSELQSTLETLTTENNRLKNKNELLVSSLDKTMKKLRANDEELEFKLDKRSIEQRIKTYYKILVSQGIVHASGSSKDELFYVLCEASGLDSEFVTVCLGLGSKVATKVNNNFKSFENSISDLENTDFDQSLMSRRPISSLFLDFLEFEASN